MTQYPTGHHASARPARNAGRLAIAALIVFGTFAAWGQTAASPGRPASSAKAASKAAVPSTTSPAWRELTAAQQQALKPLQGTWPTLTEPHKRKWIALSQSYAGMPAPEQARLHSRMSEWVALSPRQRAQARLNFAETSKHSHDEKKAKWQAYQNLSPEEKRRLAAGARPITKGAAPAIKPSSAQKLAVVPSPAMNAGGRPNVPLAGSAGKLDHNTPQPAPAAPAEALPGASAPSH